MRMKKYVYFQLEKLIEQNYYLNKSAKEAYKCYVRAYDSHSLKEIFDVNTLDLVSVAKSFGFSAPPFVDLRKYLMLFLLYITLELNLIRHLFSELTH